MRSATIPKPLQVLVARYQRAIAKVMDDRGICSSDSADNDLLALEAELCANLNETECAMLHSFMLAARCSVALVQSNGDLGKRLLTELREFGFTSVESKAHMFLSAATFFIKHNDPEFASRLLNEISDDIAVSLQQYSGLQAEADRICSRMHLK